MRWAVPFLAALSAVVYLNVLGNGFALDDEGIILNNPRIHDIFDLSAIWLRPYWPYLGVELGLWRPLSTFGYALQWAIGGGSPLVFHLVSIGLHAAVVVVGYQFLRRLAGATAAFAGALIFAVHPVHVEAVANVVGQAELIAALAVLTACWVHARMPAGTASHNRHATILAALFAAGLLAKEHAIVLPALLVLTDIATGRLSAGRGQVASYARSMMRPLAAIAIVLVLYFGLRLLVLQGQLFGVDAGPQVGYLRDGNRVLVALQAFPVYVRLLFAPIRLASDYAPGMFTPAAGLTGDVAAGALIVLLLLALALLTPIRPRIGFAAAWFVITILPASNLLFATGIFVAERTLYLPSFALAAGVAFATASMLPRMKVTARRAALAALLVFVVLGGIRTWLRNADWRSTDTIMSALVRDHPESYVAQMYLASQAVQAGRHDAARQHYERALSIWQDDSELLNEYGNFLLARGEAPAAIRHFERSLQLHPYISRTTVFLGTAYLETGRFDETLALAQQARDRGFNVAVHGPLMAAALDGLGRSTEARAAWQQVIQEAHLSPPVLWAFLVRTLARRDETELALQALAQGRYGAADPGTLRLLDELESALRSGCYTPSAPQESACDPVAAWLRSLPETYGSWSSPLDRPARLE